MSASPGEKQYLGAGMIRSTSFALGSIQYLIWVNEKWRYVGGEGEDDAEMLRTARQAVYFRRARSFWAKFSDFSDFPTGVEQLIGPRFVEGCFISGAVRSVPSLPPFIRGSWTFFYSTARNALRK